MPGIKVSSTLGRVNESTSPGMKTPGWGTKTGQNEADGQNGTINVPCALHARRWDITFVMRQTGGHNQLFSWDQSRVNTSMASAPGDQKRELKRASWVL